MKYVYLVFFVLLLGGCSVKKPIIAKSVTVILKTPTMKFYDKGFVTRYTDYIHLQVLNFGNVVLNLKIYENEICKSTFECVSSKEFNKQYLNENYSDNFMYNLFKNDIVRFKDKKNNILIKVK